MITDISQLDPNGTYTYADYLKWQFDQSVELIKGKLYDMSPAPRTKHQQVSGDLSFEIRAYMKGRGCRVFEAPFDIRLPNPDYEPGFNNKVYTVVQPDISVICDPGKIDEYGCVGPPDWVIEITSPRTMKKDFNEKFDLYEQAGVREYWIVVPKEETVNVYWLENGQYQTMGIYEEGDIPCQLFPGLIVRHPDIFA